MHNQSSTSLASQATTAGINPVFLPINAFSRFLRRAAVYYRPSASYQVFSLPCGNFLWVHYSGVRFIAPLPF